MMPKFTLTIKDSEGGDYVRIRSPRHNSEFYLHKDREIELLDVGMNFCMGNKDEWKYGYYVFAKPKGEAFYLPKCNANWTCNDCGENTYGIESWKMPEECKHCKFELDNC